MIVCNTTLTPKLARWLSESHDDGRPELQVWQQGQDIVVLTADGSPLTDTEQLEIEARMAAHAVGDAAGESSPQKENQKKSS